MKNYLINYLNKRMDELKEKNPFTKPTGPVITISREVGCGGLQISHQLAAELNKTVYCKKWQVISKEVLSESAHELQVAPEKVKRLMKSERFTFEDILAAFNDKYYKSNRVIMKTVREVIRNFAEDGCCIILGRGGHIIAGDLKNALHVRLIAPFDWRVSQLTARKELSDAEAFQYIKDTDAERDNLHKYFLKDKNAEENYDLVIDVSRFPPGMVARLISHAFECKGIPENMKKIPYF